MKRNDSTKFRIVISKWEERRKDSLTETQEVSPLSSYFLSQQVDTRVFIMLLFVTVCMSEIFQNKCFKN